MTTRPRIPRRALLVGASVAGLVAVAGCDSDTATSASSSVLDGVIEEFGSADRVAIEDFEARRLDGRRIDSSRLDGVVSVVNVWGSWCGPCRAEAPVLRAVANAYADRGVKFLGLNVRDNPAAAEAFERRFEIPYPSVHPDDAARVSLAFGGKLTTTAVPTTVVVDRRRRIASRVVGEVTRRSLEALVESALSS